MTFCATNIVRPQAAELLNRLEEPRRFMHIVAGPRQVGKTTLALHVAAQCGLPHHIASADEPTLRDSAWLEAQWETARLLAREADGKGALLVLDEIQKAANWSETVKRLWDEDARRRCPLKVLLLGSSPLLIHRDLAESLAGQFDVLRLPHWSFPEMRAAFDWTLDEYIFYGAYPGAAPLAKQPKRWSRYIRDALIETTISRDVLLLSRVDKPALLRRLFELGCAYSSQILSYVKMTGQLQDAGNTTTLAHYLDLLSAAGMLTGLQKYSGGAVRRRASSPKLQVLNTALITAQSERTLADARKDLAFWGRLVESAVGAHLANAAMTGDIALYYWRERNREVDFVVRANRKLIAIEVKSGPSAKRLSGLTAFERAFGPVRKLLVGGDGVPVETFLSMPVEAWAEG